MCYSGRIKYLRELADIKQKDLAESIGVTKATMSKYENDINIPSADILSKMADVLNTSTDYIVGRTNYLRRYGNGKIDKYSTENLFDMILKLNTENRIRIYERVMTLWEQQADV